MHSQLQAYLCPLLGWGCTRIRIASQLVSLLFNLAIGPLLRRLRHNHPTEYGCRHIDSARAYKNERQVGDAVRESGLPRKDVFISVYTTLYPDRLYYIMLGFQRPRSIRSLVVTKAALTLSMTRLRTLASV